MLYEATDSFSGIQENVIIATFADLYDREVRQASGTPDARAD